MSRHERKTRVWKAILILLAAFLMFAGPSYVVYLVREIGVSSLYSFVFGFVLLILGIAITYRLIKSGEME